MFGGPRVNRSHSLKDEVIETTTDETPTAFTVTSPATKLKQRYKVIDDWSTIFELNAKIPDGGGLFCYI